MNAVRKVKIKAKIRQIEVNRAAIESEKIAHGNCLRRRKSKAKCHVHIKNIKWLTSEIEELSDEVKVLHSQFNESDVSNYLEKLYQQEG